MPAAEPPDPRATAAIGVGTVVAVIVAWFVFGAPFWAVLIGALVVTVGANAYLATRRTRTGPSPARAAALAPTAAEPALPTVPPDRSAPDLGPGRRLAHAPADRGGPALLVVFAVGFALFAFAVAPGAVNNPAGWAGPTTQVVIVTVSVLLVVFAYRNGGTLLAAVFGGRVAVEVDAQPFAPGGTYRGRVSPTGRVTPAAVELVCEEAATYMAGTTETTARHVTARVPAGGPPADFAVTVPAAAMHSFAAANNKVRWTIRVTGRVLAVLPYEEAFAVVVRPGTGDG